jgi:hypothetical protein
VEAFFIKTPVSTFMPASEHDRGLLSKIKIGQPVRLKYTQVRNYQFHKKYFALLNLAFDYWEPPEGGMGSAWKDKIDIEKNFDRFRKDIIIRAGYYEATYRLNGDIRFEAKSIAFGNMSEDEFEELYTKTIDVIVKHVLEGYSDEMLRSVLEQVEAFE